MPEECQKAKDELKTHWGLKEKIIFSLQKWKLSMISKKAWGESTQVHRQAEERKNKGILSLDLATLIITAAYMFHSWAEINP